ncbi:ketopantoate reductase family protein [Mesorhizobium sp.]|uniref:ketopantoate reductase family protein n=1 Tax=Mesorhizobium sp. TaxID=1871066 RepID=UPI0025CBF39A|nr:2-dehydropantoate 2-reductase N-terminal domain-containing protein [Mesorhizobium sp.]
MTISTEPALIWGAGAIGSILGAALLDAGRQVVFVDIDERHLEKIRDGGLVIEGAGGDRVYRASALAPRDLQEKFATAFLCVRLNDNPQAIPALAKHLASHAKVIACQNGFGAWEVAEAFGVSNTVAASFFLPANLQGPGRVIYGSRADIALGSLDAAGRSALERAFEWLGAIDADVHTVDDIKAVIWSKLCYGALLAAAALDDGLIAEFLAAPRLRPVVVGILREMTTIASRTGHPAKDLDWFQPGLIAGDDPAVAEASLDATVARLRKSAKPISGYWTQIVQHGRRTELELMFGPVLRDAGTFGCEAKLLRTLMKLISDMESGRRTSSPDLIETLLKAAQGRA